MSRSDLGITMANHPQTIQIFLPTGDPQGIRVASITTRIIRVFDVPRSALSEFMAMEESSQVGLYFLFGESEESDQPLAYIGQTGSLRDRLSTHHKSKEFWNRALVAVSLTHSLTNTHVSFLEWLSILQATEVGRFTLENEKAGSRPHAPRPLEAECMEIHETIRTLLATLGYPIFEPLIRRRAADERGDAGRESEDELYFCRGSGAEGRGRRTDDGFVVLEGSTGRFETTPSFDPHNQQLRSELIDKGVLSVQGDRIRFERNYLFKKPSPAAACLMGRPANGMTEWKNRLGISLGDVSRLGDVTSGESTK